MTDDSTQLQQENAQLRNERDFYERQCDLYSEIITEQQAQISAVKAWATTHNYGTANMSYSKAQQQVLEILGKKVTE